MRFSDFKLVENKNPLQPVREKYFSHAIEQLMLFEVAKMSAGNWMSTGEKTAGAKAPQKYIDACVRSISSGKTFQYKDPKTKEEKAGVVDTIYIDGKETTAQGWREYAVANYPKFITTCEFLIDGDRVKCADLLKNEAVKGSLTPNKGDIAEAVLGSAIAAKFDRGGKDITKEDVVRVLKKVVASGKASGMTNYQEAGIVEDEYNFTLTLNNASMKPLKMWIEEESPMGDPTDFELVTTYEVATDVIKSLQLQITHAVEYANSNKRATTAVDKAKLEMEGKNEIRIISDGGDAANQTSTKVDLKLEYDGKPQRLLSLKAGTVKQFGQGSGGGWDQVSNFFETVLKFRLPDNLKDKFGFVDAQGRNDYLKTNYATGPFAKLYSEMAKQAMEYTKGDNAQKEYKLVQNVYDGINFHATRGEENVTMVILSPSTKIAYKELAFDARLLAALELYDLQVVNHPDLKTHRISIIGNLKTEDAIETLGDNGAVSIPSKAILVDLSSRMTGGTVRNMIEMGSLLKDLADIEKLDKAQAEKNKIAQANPEPEAEPQAEKPANDPNAKL
jgi:hypothetical protein